MINTGGFADAGTDASGVQIVGNFGRVFSNFFYGLGCLVWGIPPSAEGERITMVTSLAAGAAAAAAAARLWSCQAMY